MKSKFVSFIAIATLAVGCAEYGEEQQTVVGNYTIVGEDFYGHIDDSTRSLLDENGQVNWEADELVSIFNLSEYNLKYRVVLPEGVTSAPTADLKYVEFEGVEVDSPVEFAKNYAVYPYNAANSISGDILSFPMCEVVACGCPFDLSFAPMVAVSEGNSLSFKNPASVIRFKVKKENNPNKYLLKDITITSRLGKPLSGNATVDMTAEVPTISITADEVAKSSVTFDLCEGILLTTEEQFFYIAIPPMTFDENDLQIGYTVIRSGKEFKGSIDKDSAITFNPSKIKSTTLTISSEDFVGSTDNISTEINSGDIADLNAALNNGKDVIMTESIVGDATTGGYNLAGVIVSGNTLDGGNKSLTINGANDTWDCAIYTTGGTIKNITVGGAFRGIFTAGQSSDINVENVVIDNVCYTFSADNGNGQYSVNFKNSTLNGWTSYSNVFKSVTFTDCNFGAGTGDYTYAYLRPYNASTFINCEFEEGFEIDAMKAALSFINCTIGGKPLTADNSDVFSNGLDENDSVVYEITLGTDATISDISEATASGVDVTLTTSIYGEANITAPYGNKVAIVHNGGTLDGGGNTLSIECYGDDYAIMTKGGTIKNMTIDKGCRAIVVMYPNQDLILDNVHLGGDGVLYPLNTTEAGEAVSIYASNSTFSGWTSFSNIESAHFTNCVFGQGTYYGPDSTSVYGRLIRPYVNTVFEGCEFLRSYYIDLSAFGGESVRFINCTVDGMPLTSLDQFRDYSDGDSDNSLESLGDYLLWIEAPAGNNVSDIVTFE